LPQPQRKLLSRRDAETAETQHTAGDLQRLLASRGRAVLGEDKAVEARKHVSVDPWPGDVVAQFWPKNPLPEQRECCSKDKVEDYILWQECFMQPLMSPNFTDTGLKQIAAGGGLQAYTKLLKTGIC
jgi:hypothetical protein